MHTPLALITSRRPHCQPLTPPAPLLSHPCRRVFWLSAADPALGYSVDFPTISMHAVATDAESFNKPCLYLQLDSGAEDDEGLGQLGGSDSGSEDGEEEGSSGAEPLLPELRLIPADAAQRERPPPRRLPAPACPCLCTLGAALLPSCARS